MGSDLRPDWPFTDGKWIKPPAKIRTFRLHKDRRWDDFKSHFRPHKDQTFYRIYQGPQSRSKLNVNVLKLSYYKSIVICLVLGLFQETTGVLLGAPHTSYPPVTWLRQAPTLSRTCLCSPASVSSLATLNVASYTRIYGRARSTLKVPGPWSAS